MKSSVHITGIGWLTSRCYGAVSQGTCTEYAKQSSLNTLWKDDPFFGPAIKNFGRFDNASKMATTVTAIRK